MYFYPHQYQQMSYLKTMGFFIFAYTKSRQRSRSDLFEKLLHEGNQGVSSDIWLHVLVKGQIDRELFL